MIIAVGQHSLWAHLVYANPLMAGEINPPKPRPKYNYHILMFVPPSEVRHNVSDTTP